jgi:hypothetical protein
MMKKEEADLLCLILLRGSLRLLDEEKNFFIFKREATTTPEDWCAIINLLENGRAHKKKNFSQPRGRLSSQCDSLRAPELREINLFTFLSLSKPSWDFPGRKSAKRFSKRTLKRSHEREMKNPIKTKKPWNILLPASLSFAGTVETFERARRERNSKLFSPWFRLLSVVVSSRVARSFKKSFTGRLKWKIFVIYRKLMKWICWKR